MTVELPTMRTASEPRVIEPIPKGTICGPRGELVPTAQRVEAPAVSSGSASTVYERARAYVARMPEAISGARGHDATMNVAIALVRGFELSDADALAILRSDYNGRCVPPWSEAELRHKVQSAAHASRAGLGYLRDAPLPAASRPASAPGVNAAPLGSDAPGSIVLLGGPQLAEPLPDLSYLVREIGMVDGAGAPHMLAGYGFSGKTLAAQALALALAAGTSVWGAYASGQGRPVLHVDLEQGRRTTQRRYQRLAAAAGVDLASLGDALAVAVMPDLRLAPEHFDKWRGVMAGRHLAIVDSLKVAAGDVDENSSDMRARLDMLGKLSEATGCRALVIHHARKPSPDAASGRYTIRGSGAIFDALDSAYVFSAEKGEPIKVEHAKAREHGEQVPDFALKVTDVEIDGASRAGLAVTVHGAEIVTEQRERREQAARTARAEHDAATVRKVLASRQGLGTRELRAAVGMSVDRLTAALAQLGDALDVRNEKANGVRFTRHYLRWQP